MRCQFNVSLCVDIDATDDKLRKAFLDLITQRAREMYGVAGMLAKDAPEVQVSVTDRDGKMIIPLFEGALVDHDEDEGE